MPGDPTTRIQGRAGARSSLTVVLVFAFGLIVPVLVLASNGENKASVAAAACT